VLEEARIRGVIQQNPSRLKELTNEPSKDVDLGKEKEISFISRKICWILSFLFMWRKDTKLEKFISHLT